MKPYRRSAIVIIKDDKILLMYRVNKDKKYYCFPGGEPEEGETPKQTAVREVKEETTLDVTLGELLCEVEETDSRGGIGYYYLCTGFTGTAELSGEEKGFSCPENLYELQWVDMDKLDDLVVYPEEVVKKIRTHN